MINVRTGRFLVFGLALLVVACAASNSPDVYSSREAKRAYKVYEATVTELRAVKIEGDSTRVGTLGGAWIGSSVGGTAGGGDGSSIAAAIGGVAGAVIGRGIERELTSDEALEITLELDNGDTVAVVQGDDVGFVIGERVRVLRDRASARVVKRQ